MRLDETECGALKRFGTETASQATHDGYGVCRLETESSALATNWKSACRRFDPAPGHHRILRN